MTTLELLTALRRRRVRLWLDGEQLRFQAPKGALTPELKDELVAGKEEVIAFLRRAEAAAKDTAPPIEPVERDGERLADGSLLPLSWAQERLWFLDGWQPGAAYNLPQPVRCRGLLDRRALARALSALVERHEALRTVFPEVDGQAAQRVLAPAPVALPVIDLAALAPERREAELVRLVAEEARRPFDLVRGPLLRTALVGLDGGDVRDQEAVLLLDMHHIVSDGWSMGVFVGEMASLYRAAAGGGQAQLAPLPVQYADFAVWQRRWLVGDALDELVEAWRERLDGAPRVLDLPTDRPRPPAASQRGAALPFTLPAPLVDRVRAAARAPEAEGVTPFMVLLAVYALLLGRLTGGDDLPVGTPIANRNRSRIEGLIGFFVNTLVLRTRVDPGATFAEVLRGVRDVTLDAYAHQDLPFARLVEELSPERDTAHAPLVQVAFVLQNAPMPALEVEGLTLEPVLLETETAKFDLTLALTDAPDGDPMVGTLEHATDLFDATTAERLARRFRVLLEAALEGPGWGGRAVAELPWLDAEERHQLLEWGTGEPAARPRPGEDPDDTVLDRFHRAAAARPDALAVVGPRPDGGTVRRTYGELAAEARVLAERLRALGAGPGRVVGVLERRGPSLLGSLLAVMETGAAYLPLDPAYPPERQNAMLEDARAVAWLAPADLAGDPTEDGATHRSLRPPRVDPSAVDGAPPTDAPGGGAPGPTPDAAAYVIYTSGSTGRPKGVLVGHRSLSGLVSWHRRAYDLGPGDRVALVAGTAFDASAWEIWPALAVGASLHAPAAELRSDPAGLARWLVDEGIHVAFLPTPLAEAVMPRLEESGAGSLRALLTGGDRLRRRPGPALGCLLVNHYGPTEDTVVTTAGVVRPGGFGAPSIGRPIDGETVTLVDASLRPVGVGVPGELAIGGDGLALGYLGRPAATAERFVPDPFAGPGRPGARLYRTGDLVRWSADGRLEFSGRFDHQVKVRGFRIELGEVEVALAAHPAVNEAVVTVAAGEMVAYVVPAAAPGPERLREHLAASLPDYMVPSAYVALEGLPVDANGKLDRSALPEPGRDARVSQAGAAPRTEVEELLAGIWAEVLERDTLPGIHDSFFDLGGHSLLATRLLSRVQATFGLDLPLRALFEAPTVAGLARAVETAREEGRGRHLPPVEPVPRTAPDGTPRRLPLSFAEERLWFFEQLHPGTAAYNTYRAGRLHGPLDLGAVDRMFNALVARHEILRTRFLLDPEIDDRPVQVVEPFTPRRVPVVDLGGLPRERREREVLALANADAARPFDLARGPLLRVSVVLLDEGETVVTLSIHHIAYDLWSGSILLGEMERLYLAFAESDGEGDGDPDLPALPIQVADFAVWQRRWLEGEVIDRQLDYWRARLAGSPQDVSLPPDRPRPPVQTFRGGGVVRVLPPELSEELAALGRGEGVSQFMLLLAVFCSLLFRLTGRDDLPLGSAIANRNAVELEGLLGYFDNTLVLRSDASGDPTFLDLLDRVRETALGAYAHADVPFESLVETLEPEREGSRHPFFQLMFLYLLNYPAMDRRLAGLTMKPLTLHSGAVKFDCTFALRESPQGLVCSAEYNADLYDRTTIVRLLERFERVARQVVAAPEILLSGLALLSAAERHQALMGWNDTRRNLPGTDGLLHELVLSVLAEDGDRGDRPALLDGSPGGWSRSDLVRASERLARAIASHLAGAAEPRVAVVLSRSAMLVASWLAVLRSGAAFVPVDPESPDERLAYLVGDSGAHLVLAGPEVAARLPAGVPILDPAAALAEASSSEPGDEPPAPPVGVHPGSVAYVIYTSGSTGQPKGVAVSHAAIVHRLLWAQCAYPLTTEDRLLQLTAPTFDFAVWEIFGTLLAGACLVLQPVDEAGDLVALVRRVERQGVTALHFVPSAAVPFLEIPGVEEACATVRLVWSGGEALTPTLAARMAALVGEAGAGVPGSGLYNQYGPTETTVDSSWHRVSARDLAAGREIGGGRVPIGRPISNTTLHVLDRRLEPVVPGAAGELAVGGVGLARGYLGRPGLTAERFVPAPFGDPGGRLYRTGDLVRARHDGALESLGRIDRQVKVRGFRIELGEVETALAGHPGVAEGAVVVDRSVPGGRLVAYWTGRADVGADQEASADALREHLGERLPAFMVPSLIIPVGEMPRLPSGKLDRGALPAPATALGWDREDEDDGFGAPPQGAAEELIAALWGDLLGVPSVGRDVDFFRLGGHSLLATRVVSRLRRALGVELPLRALFEEPTVAGLARRVEEQRAASAGPVEEIEPVDRSVPLPLSFAQERLWFLDRFDPGSPAYNVPRVLHLAGRLDAAALAAAFTALVERHETLRTTFPERGGVPVQRIHPPAPLALPVVDLFHLPAGAAEVERRRLATAWSLRSFDLAGRDGSTGLLRTALLRLPAPTADGLHDLLLTVHHIVSDGWSTSILVREMGALYLAATEGRAVDWEPLPVQYADVAAWQRRHLSGAALEAEVTWWRERLEGLAPVLELPADRPRPAVASGRGKRRELDSGDGLAARVADAAARVGTTPFVVFAAAFALLLRRLTGRDDVAFGTPVANRGRAETEALIGFFVNTLVLRVDLAAAGTFAQLVEQVGRCSMESQLHQELPFEKLVEELAPRRSLSHAPLVQVLFVLENNPRSALELPGLEITAEPMPSGAAKFDLTLFASSAHAGGALGVDYATDLFDDATVRRWVESYADLLDAALEDPETTLDRLATRVEVELVAPPASAQEAPAPERRPAPALTPTPRPTDPLADTLGEIWRSVLGSRPVAADDDFFALGGHSLLATQLVSRVRDRLAVEVPVRTLFESPRLGKFAARVRALLDQSRGLDMPPVEPVPRRPGADGRARLPLSFAQERLWFLSRLLGESPAYHLPDLVRLRGPLNVAALARSLGRIVERHESLRTIFEEVDGTPVQVIAPVGAAPVGLPVVDLAGLPVPRAEDEGRRLGRRLARAPFDLAAGPLVRAALVRFAADDHLAALVLHHIVSDGWSMGVLLGELAHGYGGGAPLAPLPVAVADHAAWQRRWLDGKPRERLLAFWRRHLGVADGATVPVLDLPTDLPRPAVQEGRGARRPVVLAANLGARVAHLARKRQTTPFAVLLAAFSSLLGRWAGQDRFAVATPIAGRTRSEIEGLIGFFVNTLAVGVDLDAAGASFGALVEATGGDLLDAYEHQELPFELLVEDLAPVRSLSHAPLAQVMLVLQNTPDRRPELPGLEASAEPTAQMPAKLDLTLVLAELPDGGLEGAVLYDADLFDATTVERWVRQLGLVLESAVAAPERPWRELPLLTSVARHQVLVEAADTAVTGEAPAAHVAFARRAAAAPGSVALSTVATSDEPARLLSAGELLERSRALATTFAELGVGPETVVALHLERSPELIASILGVLGAGGAFLLVDPALPAGRRRFMVEDASARWLVSRRGLGAAEIGGPSVRGVTFEDLDAAEVPAAGELAPPVTPEQLAYVLYTSGSTGRPKGVMVSHGSLAAQLAWLARAVPLEPGDRLLQRTSLAFDACLWEIFAPLAQGAELVLLPPGDEADPRAWREAIEAAGVTVVQAVPSLWSLWLDEAAPGDGTGSLRRLIAGGEALPTELARRLAVTTGAEVVNFYGPTEATIQALAQPRADAVQSAAGIVPIGRPVDRSRALVVDPAGRPVPPGVPGELHLAGDCLARGYRGRPARTAVAFVPDPHGKSPGARRYRTGDLVRLGPEGAFEYLERIDRQVKLRGVRVELGEIESLLAGREEVREAVVDLVGPEARRVLVAWVAAGGPDEPAPPELAERLRSGLAEELPRAVVPAVVVVVDRLARTPSGKIDRGALPAPEDLGTGAPRGEAKPLETAAERAVAEIWTDLLGSDAVLGAGSDFFHHGGHSLLAVRLLFRVRRDLGVEVPLARFLAAPTVAELARAVEASGGVLTAPAARETLLETTLVLREGGDGPPLFLVHPLLGSVAPYEPFVGALDHDGPVVGLEAPGLEPGQNPLDRFEALADHHARALLGRHPVGPCILGGWSFGGVLAHAVARRLGEIAPREVEVLRLVLLDSWLVAPAEREELSDEARFLAFVGELAPAYGVAVPADGDRLTGLATDAERLDILEELAAGSLPAGVDRETLERLHRLHGAHLEGLLRHRAEPLPKVPALLVRPAALDEADGAALERSAEPWRAVCPDGLEVETVDADHRGMLSPRVAAALGRLLPQPTPVAG